MPCGATTTGWRSGGPIAVRRPPPWLWIASLGTGLVLMVALVLFVNAHNTNSTPHNQGPNSAANRLRAQLIVQDEAPRVVRLTVDQRRGASAHPQTAIMAAIRGDIAKRKFDGTVNGRLQSVRCTPAAPQNNRIQLSCVADVSNVNYDYVGVIDTGAGVLTYCRRDPREYPLPLIPVSARCLA
jgi:hypothetical protein